MANMTVAATDFDARSMNTRAPESTLVAMMTENRCVGNEQNRRGHLCSPLKGPNKSARKLGTVRPRIPVMLRIVIYP